MLGKGSSNLVANSSFIAGAGILFFCFFASAVRAESYITVLIEGRAQPYLNSAYGNIGINPSTNVLEESLANASIQLDAGVSNILLRSPSAGSYHFTLNGAFSDRISITVTYYDDTSGITEERSATAWFHGSLFEFALVYDSMSNPAIQLEPTLRAPDEVTVLDVGGKVELQWSEVIDPALAAYKIYARNEMSPYFELLVETNALMYQTDHAVREDEIGEHWQYIVLGVNTEGRESFHIDPVTNLVKLSALFSSDKVGGGVPLSVSFNNSTLGSVDTLEWDFDGDGFTDAFGPEPMYTYTEAGEYDVTLRVYGLQGESTLTRYGYISVYIDSDGDQISDEEEIMLGLNPANEDSDGDGLVDGNSGVVLVADYLGGLDLDLDGYVDGERSLGTDPNEADTDGDGVSDGDELLEGSDPFVAESGSGFADGDLNQDDIVNFSDVVIAMRILRGEVELAPEHLEHGDVAPLVEGVPVPDGKFDLGDLVMIQRKVMGLVAF